ncbi:MAG: hypothetical protein LUK37_09725 [Clostridia bacterium]|nr:hypothetical protein [Clostridia bacterium]
MPAYFNLSVQFRREDLYPLFVRDFYAVLHKAGMAFQSGYWGFENDSLEEIIEWNQRKLEDDFELGFTEHHSHDYKQVIYGFGGYSEVRGFWMNNYPESGAFTHEIILPESDVLENGYPAKFIKEKMEELLELTIRIWQFSLVKAIQTGLEGNDASVSLSKLTGGEYPNTLPFALVEDMGNCYEDSLYNIQHVSEGRDGLLFLQK